MGLIGNRLALADLVAIVDSDTRIEFKYATRRRLGTEGITDKQFELRDHAAMDLARRHFVHDAYRLERLTSAPGSNGLAIMLTNSPSLWNPARTSTRDAAFRIHEGRTFTDDLAWGTPE